MPRYITFDVHYYLEIICFQIGSAIVDKHKELVIATFRNNLTQKPSAPTELLTDPIFSAANMNPLANFSVDVSLSKKSSLRAISTSIHLQENSVTKLPKLKGLSTENMASNSVSKAYLSTISEPSSAISTDKNVTSLPSVLQSHGNYTTADFLSVVKLETTKVSLTFGSTKAVSAVSSTLLIDQLSTENYSTISVSSGGHSSDDNNDFLDSPVTTIAAVSSAAGVVGLGAAGVLRYYASQRCRIPTAVRFVAELAILA